MVGVVRVPLALFLLPILSLVLSIPLSEQVAQPLSINSSPPETLNLTNINPIKPTNTTLPSSLGVWPILPYWTKIHNSDPPAFLDIYSLGTHATTRQAYILQELILIPLIHKVSEGAEPAGNPEDISNAGLQATYVPNEHRPPVRKVAAGAIAALAFLENRFGARVVEAGVRLGMVKAATIEVRFEDGKMV